MKMTGEVLVSRMWFKGFSPGEWGWGWGGWGRCGSVDLRGHGERAISLAPAQPGLLINRLLT